MNSQEHVVVRLTVVTSHGHVVVRLIVVNSQEHVIVRLTGLTSPEHVVVRIIVVTSHEHVVVWLTVMTSPFIPPIPRQKVFGSPLMKLKQVVSRCFCREQQFVEVVVPFFLGLPLLTLPRALHWKMALERSFDLAQ